MKLYKRFAAVAAAALMSLSLTACGDTSWVYKTDSDTVSSGVYLGYLTQAYIGGQSAEGFDSTIKNIWKQKINDMSYKDYVNQTAEESSKRYLAISQKFDEMGLELSEEELSTVDMQAELYWNYGYQQYFQPNGTSLESYKKMLISSMKESAIFDAYYNEGGLEEVSKDDLIKNLKENYVDINYFEMSFAQDDDSVLPSSEIEALKKQAEGYADRINSGENTFNEVKTEYDDEVAKKEAEENEEEFTATDPEDIEKDEDTKELYSKDSTSMSEDFTTAVFEDIETSKATVITVGTSYYVVVKYDMDDDLDSNLEEAKGTILSNLKGEDFTNMVTEWMDAITMDENTSALHKYNPKNIVMPEN